MPPYRTATHRWTLLRRVQFDGVKLFQENAARCSNGYRYAVQLPPSSRTLRTQNSEVEAGGGSSPHVLGSVLLQVDRGKVEAGPLHVAAAAGSRSAHAWTVGSTHGYSPRSSASNMCADDACVQPPRSLQPYVLHFSSSLSVTVACDSSPLSEHSCRLIVITCAQLIPPRRSPRDRWWCNETRVSASYKLVGTVLTHALPGVACATSSSLSWPRHPLSNWRRRRAAPK